MLSILTGVRDLAIDGQQKIVASTGYEVQRFESDGSADQSFNNGQRLYTYTLLGNAYSEGMTVDGLNRILLTGRRYISFSDDPATTPAPTV